METFDFDSHFRRMERANDEEFAVLQQAIHNYLHNGPVNEQQDRISAWKQALDRLHERSETELALMKELIVTSEVA